jgi:hypothetical protein
MGRPFDLDSIEPNGPTLETICPYCEGKGGEEPMYESGWDVCWNCMGAGYIPTKYGNKVLALLRHNLRSIMQSVSED